MALTIRLLIAYKLLVASSVIASYPHPQHYEVPAKYDFGYAVKDDYSGNDYAHHETREGYKTTGEYRVLLPDGRVQVVSYTADETGYHPVVSYEGEAKHTDYKSYKPAPYKQDPIHPPLYKQPAPYKQPPLPPPHYKPDPHPPVHHKHLPTPPHPYRPGPHPPSPYGPHHSHPATYNAIPLNYPSQYEPRHSPYKPNPYKLTPYKPLYTEPSGGQVETSGEDKRE